MFLGDATADASIVEGMGGFQQIVKEGVVIPSPGGAVHPRTAIGVNQTGRVMWLVVVDGRQAGYSEGMDLHQLAGVMRDLGCWHATNMDGGGSSVMGLAGTDEISELTREFNLLYDALQRSQSDVQAARKQGEHEVLTQAERFRLVLQELEKRTQTDPLTGLMNRRHFAEQFSYMFSRARERGADMACIMIDIDHFKVVNDTFGHGVGDNVIAFVGQLLRASVWLTDLRARYGGDEFVVVMQDTSAEEARAVAERIRQLFVREAGTMAGLGRCKVKKGDQKIKVGLSMGVATMAVHHPESAAELLRLADTALYQAKHAGRNRVVYC